MEIEEVSDEEYIVNCPYQSASSQKTKRHYKACFDIAICKQCPLSGSCPAKQQGDKRTYQSQGQVAYSWAVQDDGVCACDGDFNKLWSCLAVSG